LKTLGGIAISAGAMAVVLLGLSYMLWPYFRSTMVVEILALGVLIGASGAVYLVLAHVTGAQRLDQVLRLLTRKSGPPPMPEA